MQFQTLEEKDSVTHVAVRGRINGVDIAPPADPLRHLLGASAYQRNVVLHLADAEYIDSMAVAWLVSCNKKFREGGGKLVLHSLHPSVMKILKLLKLDSILNIAPDAVSAHKVVRGEAS
jgi:anti-anti-sigma factor